MGHDRLPVLPPEHQVVPVVVARAERQLLLRLPLAVGTNTATVSESRSVERLLCGVFGSENVFAVSERVAQPEPDGFLGPWALHLTAFSPTLIDFGGGPGTVAIHGRAGASLRDPLGTARSHGCIRIPNEAIRLLARVAREGTPVQIVP